MNNIEILNVKPSTLEGGLLSDRMHSAIFNHVNLGNRVLDGYLDNLNLTFGSGEVIIRDGLVSINNRLIEHDNVFRFSVPEHYHFFIVGTIEGSRKNITNIRLRVIVQLQGDVLDLQSNIEQFDTLGQYDYLIYKGIRLSANDFNILEDNRNLKTDNLDSIYPIGSIYMSVSSDNPTHLFGGVWQAYAQGRTLIGVGSNGRSNYLRANQTGGAETHVLTEAQLPIHAHNLAEHTHTLNINTNSTGAHTHTTASAGAHTHGSGTGNQARFVTCAAGLTGTGVMAFNNADNPRAVAAVNARSQQFGAPTATASSGAHTHNVNSGGAHSHNVSGTTSASNGNTSNVGSNNEHNNMQPFITCFIWHRVA